MTYVTFSETEELFWMPILTLKLGGTLIAASTVFSWFGLLYLSIPVVVLLTATMYFRTSFCRAFWLFVSGGVAASVTMWCLVFVFAPKLTDDELPLVVNASASIGAIVGVICFRVAHEIVRRSQTQDRKPKS